jgi:hypothetical protein
MTDDDPAPGALGDQLPLIDLPPDRAARIAQRARHQLGHGLPLAARLEPFVVAAAALGYLAWAIARVLEGLR